MHVWVTACVCQVLEGHAVPRREIFSILDLTNVNKIKESVCSHRGAGASSTVGAYTFLNHILLNQESKK